MVYVLFEFELLAYTRAEMAPRKSYTASEKLKVIAYAEEHSNAAAEKEFGIRESNIRSWRKDKIKLQEMPKSKKVAKGRPASHPALEQKVVLWVRERRAAGIGVSTKDIRMKALQIARTIGGLSDFKASVGWCRRFMRRNLLSLRRRTHIAQKLPSDFEDKLISFQRYIIKLRKLYDYELSQIGNADQTPLTFDLPFTTTVSELGEKSVN